MGTGGGSQGEGRWQGYKGKGKEHEKEKGDKGEKGQEMQETGGEGTAPAAAFVAALKERLLTESFSVAQEEDKPCEASPVTEENLADMLFAQVPVEEIAVASRCGAAPAVGVAGVKAESMQMMREGARRRVATPPPVLATRGPVPRPSSSADAYVEVEYDELSTMEELDFHRVLPSDLVEYTAMPGVLGWVLEAMMIFNMVLMDLVAWIPMLFSIVYHIFNFAMPECGKGCRMVLELRGDGRCYCQAPCCLVKGHRSDCSHACRKHMNEGLARGISFLPWSDQCRLSLEWWSCRVLWTLGRFRRYTVGFISKWISLRMIMILVTFVSMFLYLHGTGPREGMHHEDLPRFAETFDMMAESSTSRISLPQGYHKQAYVFIGDKPVLATFDSGSFRNAISADFLERLERAQQQRIHEEGVEVTITDRVPCEPTDITGIVAGVSGAYSEVVGVMVTFREDSGRSASVRLLCIVLPAMSSDMIIGCPTLDRMRYASDRESIELREYDLVIPTVIPEPECEGDASSSARPPDRVA